MTTKHAPLLALIVLVCLVLTSAADPLRPLLTDDGTVVQHGGLVPFDRSEVDTVFLLGNPADPAQGPLFSGTFEDPSGAPDWNGWTHVDATLPSLGSYWQVSEFQAVAGQYSMWCGAEFDGDPGYGNDWSTSLDFIHHVDDPLTATEVRWAAAIRHDLEHGYDFLYLQYKRGGVWTTLEAYDSAALVQADLAFTYLPGDYVGDALDQVHLRFLVETDGAWSDQDGLWDTDGACQLDEITVTVAGVVVDHEDFEDQVSDRWQESQAVGCGDFAALYQNLQDVDPCLHNTSTQVAFIDDGVVVPGTGGTVGQTWRYGPGGYIVNNTGGLNPESYISNHVVSPPLPWPAGCDGALLEFDAYLHEELGDYNVSPGIFAAWHVKSVDTGDPADLDMAPLRNRNLVLYGPGAYRRITRDVTDLLEAGRTHVQVVLEVVEYGYIWGWVGTDGTPAPYFDNVQFKAFPYAGPTIVARTTDLFNDAFVEQGFIDIDDLASNSVRLDCARNLAADDGMIGAPGDSIWVDVTTPRPGAVLVEYPEFHVRMRANPLFDAYRILPETFNSTPGFFEDGWTLIEGYVDMDSTFNNNLTPPARVQNRWEVDLPDEFFFFPGDVLKWYVCAQDDVTGNIGTTLLPADTSGYSSFVLNLDYPVDYTVRALPTVWSNSSGELQQPPILFWPHGLTDVAIKAWLQEFENCGFYLGSRLDMFVTNAPSSRLGNGLGGRTVPGALQGYRTFIYSSGSLSMQSLSSGQFDDPSDDLGLLTAWFEQGDRNAAFLGDDFLSGVLGEGAAGAAFAAEYLQAQLAASDVSPLIGNQMAPEVVPVDGQWFHPSDRWIIAGGCPSIKRFDAVVTAGTAGRVAEFTDPNGDPGGYEYAAGWLSIHDGLGLKLMVFPHDLTSVEPTADWEPPYGFWHWTMRTVFLKSMLSCLGENTYWPIPSVEDTPAVTSARCYPNPFNPQARIDLTLARAGRATVTIYNVRGERVCRLLDAELPAGPHALTWDGASDQGRQVASGVYFYEVKAPDRTLVDKLTLVR